MHTEQSIAGERSTKKREAILSLPTGERQESPVIHVSCLLKILDQKKRLEGAFHLKTKLSKMHGI